MITNITSVSIKNCIIDEAHLRDSVASTVDLTPTKEIWQPDSILMAKFQGNLEAGNIDNEGLEIERFVINRRKVDESNSIKIGSVPFEEAGEMEFLDYTQGNHKYIYTIIPVSINQTEGQYNDFEVESEFTGWYVYDKDTDEVLQFDKAIGGQNSVETVFNKENVQINTFSQYPTIYKLPQAYHSFSLSAVMLPEDNEKSGDFYNRILNNFIMKSKPFFVKGSTGETYVCSLSNLRKVTPQNAYKGYDFATITIDAIEVDSVENYVKEG